MALAALRPEERTGLAVAVVLHVALVAVLLLQPRPAHRIPIPERMAVSLVEEVGPTATAPAVSQKAQVAVAPTIAKDIAPPAPPQPPVEAKPEPRETPKPEPKPVPKPTPKPTPAKPAPAKPTPAKPVPTKPTPAKPKPTPAPPAPAKPAPAKPAPAKPAAAQPSTAKTAPATPATKPGGGSKLGSDFLKGAELGEADANAPVAASQIGAEARASLAQAIARQLKPHWSSPQGADADLLVTVLAFDLNRDGTLAGTPRVVEQTGITDANRAQAARHKELAIRAVQLAAPFDLPAKYYNGWKRVTAFRFDRKLSQ
jgi:outer membrane biosynthesis protein TonB